MRTRSLVTAGVVSLLGVVGAGTPAAAGTWPEPWQPYQTENFVTPAGKYCDFELAVTALEDGEEFRVDARYPNGAVRVNEFRGTLITRFTNVATSESTVRDLSGHAWQELYPDGETTMSFTGIGPYGYGFRATDGFPRGYYRFDGLHKITIAPDGTRAMAIDGGPTENICETLR